MGAGPMPAAERRQRSRAKQSGDPGAGKVDLLSGGSLNRRPVHRWWSRRSTNRAGRVLTAPLARGALWRQSSHREHLDSAQHLLVDLLAETWWVFAPPPAIGAEEVRALGRGPYEPDPSAYTPREPLDVQRERYVENGRFRPRRAGQLRQDRDRNRQIDVTGAVRFQLGDPLQPFALCQTPVVDIKAVVSAGSGQFLPEHIEVQSLERVQRGDVYHVQRDDGDADKWKRHASHTCGDSGEASRATQLEPLSAPHRLREK